MKNCKYRKTCMCPYGLESRQSLPSTTFKTIRFICMTWMGAGTFCLVTLSMSVRIMRLIWRKWQQNRRLRSGGPDTSPFSSRSITESWVNGGPRCAKSMTKMDAHTLLGGNEESILLLDETSFLKKGTCRVRVARQYCGCSGKIENGQVAILGAIGCG